MSVEDADELKKMNMEVVVAYFKSSPSFGWRSWKNVKKVSEGKQSPSP
jgi:hypothetical protein